jgi:hypothetical protein
VFRHGPLWSGTRSLHRSHLNPLVQCEGDPATLGFFKDGEDHLYLMVVNGNPCSWARLTLKVNVMEENLYVFDYGDALFRELWPPDPRNQIVLLAPGEGRLFKVGGEGLGQNF